MKRFQSKGNQYNKNKSKNSNHNNRHDSAEEDNEKYVIVVSNVENDFAKIHQNQLVSFCSLDPTLQKYNVKKNKKKIEKQANGEAREQGKEKEKEADATAVDAEDDSSTMHCFYEISCRQETRTAELQVYADSASRSIAPIFNQKRPQQQHEQHHHQDSRKRGREGDDVDDKSHGHASAAEQGETLLVQEDLRNLAHDETSSSPGDDSQYVYNSLTSMVMQLQRKPYFHSYLNMYVSLPGYAEGDALVLESSAAAAAEDAEEQSKAKPIVRIKQFGATQPELVACPLQLSQARPQDAITHLLADLPGFVSLFPLHESMNNNNSHNGNNNNRRNPNSAFRAAHGITSRNFRIVFQSKKYLFQAKHLLDQFELEGNLRVHMKLNDNLAKEEEVFRHEEEEKGALGRSHPISVIDDVNADASLPF